MIDTAFLIPIDHRGIHGLLFEQYLELHTWCEENNSQIVTCQGMFLNFARNHLATGGSGYMDPTPIEAEWLFWIDSDIQFTMDQIKHLHGIKDRHKFVTGWYQSNFTDAAMVGLWDKKHFRKHLHMPFTSAKFLKEKAEESDKLLRVDWCGFGFTRVHRSIYEKMKYPYYPLNHVSVKGCVDPNNKDRIFDVEDLSFEDVSFCNNCYKVTGIKPLVVPKLRVGHLKSFII